MPPTPLPLNNPNHPTVLYNAMIHPLIGFPVRGIIWYQGCSNVGRGKQYEPLFQTLIHDWRRQFGNPQMPFYFVQLANYLTPSDLQPDSQWALLRESQAKALCLPNTGMAVNIDLGDARDIHPKTKRELGRRLAAVALHNTYGKKKTVFTAPLYKDFAVKDGQIHIYFSQPEGSEPLVQDDRLPGFIIQGADLKWHVAEARTVGDAEVVVSSPEVRYPIAVRYGWADNPTCTLRTQSGFHVAPFRTDY
jgi:sialate O-acetylesterase